MEPEPRPTDLWVGVLGPLALRVDGADVKVPGVRRRALLATLALARGRMVGAERLVDALWPDAPPDDAVQALYNHVSRLRGDLGPAGRRLTRRGAGYVLDLTDDELDATVVRGMADGLAELPPQGVLGRARRALDLWRGPALEEFRGHPDLEVEAVALDELRLRLQDELVRARIEVGDGSAVADASTSVAAEPLRERGVLLLMRALAGEGRAAEALAAGASYRRRLAEETGLDPGPALGRLEQEIAAGDLAPRGQPTAGPGRRTVARPSGPLVGRQQDYDEVLRLLAGHRVVTISGPGGVGKTRLAIEVAAGLAEAGQVEAVVVDLAAVEDATRLVQAVVSTIGLRLIAAQPSTPVEVAATLADTSLLLLLDNAEHLAEACRELVDAIDRHAPAVRMLVTSRVTLHAASEYVVRLQPLPTPRDAGDLTSLERQPSVRAFLEHARRHDRGFELTALDAVPLVEILQHLDGLPLAIELVAGQVAMLPLTAVRDRLGRSLDLATVGEGHEEDRQRTLRLTIRWSYDRLTSAQQALFRAIAAHPGGVDLVTVEELADEVAPGHDPMRLLHGLVDASLLDVDRGRTRYRLLFTVRAFLLEEVAALGETADAEDRFLRWAVRAAEEIGAGLYSATETLADRRLRAELDNLRAARDLARTRGLLDERVEITLAVDQPSIWRDLREIWSWCLELATAPEIAGHHREVEILGAGAEAARQAGDYDLAVELGTRGLDVAGTGGTASATARCWSALAAVAHYRGDFAAAARDWERSARALGPLAAGLLASGALAAAYGGDRARAATILADASRQVELRPSGGNHAFITYVDGELASADNPEVALARYTAAVEEAHSVGATFVAGVAEVAMATLQARIGDVATAAVAYSRLLDAWRTSGHGPQLWTTARNAAALLLAHGHRREAALLLLRADATPDAAAVDPEIARHSGRTFIPVESVVSAEELEGLRAEVATMSTKDVVELARAALSRIAAT